MAWVWLCYFKKPLICVLLQTRNQALRAWFSNSRYGGWMEAESHNWSHFFGKQNWHCEMNRRCKSVGRDMMFLASNSLHNPRGQKWSCPCYHARHLQQIHRNKFFYNLSIVLLVHSWWSNRRNHGKTIYPTDFLRDNMGMIIYDLRGCGGC